MVMSAAKTVDAYLASLPSDRRSAISRVRDLVLRSLPEGYVEGMGYGMINYSIPLSRYPNTYNGQALCYIGLAAQKNFNAIYLMGVYSDPVRTKRFTDGFAKAGKKLDIGKSCVRFKSPDDLALEAIAETIAGLPVDGFIALYERSRTPAQRARAAKKQAKTTGKSAKRASQKTAQKRATSSARTVTHRKTTARKGTK
jgi:hypothetical protein